MNAQTTYFHHSPPPLEGTASSRGRSAEQPQFSRKPYYSSVRTTAVERGGGGGGRRNLSCACGQFKQASIYHPIYPNGGIQVPGLCNQDSIIDSHTCTAKSCK